MRKKLFVLLFSFCFFSIMKSCPMSIYNNLKTKVFIVDPHGTTAIYIKSGKYKIIDPTVHGWKKYFLKEKLNIYLENDNGEFLHRYQLIEKFCTKEETKLSLTDIKGFIEKPTKRFTTKVYEETNDIVHVHSH